MSLLSNQVRVEILAILAGTYMCVSELADELEIDASTVSHSLKQLATMGLVGHAAVEKRHFYYLSDAVEVIVRGPMVRVAVSTSAGGRVLIRASVR